MNKGSFFQAACSLPDVEMFIPLTCATLGIADSE